MKRNLLPLTAAVVLSAVAPASAAPFTPKESVPVSDPGARNPVISHDARIARILAYEQGGNVRLVERVGGYDLNANRTWRPGRTATIAGASGPDLSGGPNDRATLVAYVKGGSAYTARVSGSGRRRIVRGGVSDVAINGDAEKVAYVNSRGLYVYDRILRKSTRIATGASNPVFGKSPKGTTSFFTYTKGGSIFRASHARSRGKGKVTSRRLVAGTNAAPHGRTVDVAYQQRDTVLRASDAIGTSTVSTNGASDPDVTDGGEFVVFTSVNPNLGVPFGSSSIFVWTEKRRQNERLSPNGVRATNVETSANGNYVFYEGVEGGQEPRIWMTYLGGK